MGQPKAYLEKSGDEWYDDFVYISRDPLIRRGYKIVPFCGSDLDNNLLNKPINFDEDIIIGTVEAITAAFNVNNIIMPPNLSYPEELKPYLGREVSLIDFKDAGTNFPYFMKPAESVKLFTGDVFSQQSHLDWINKNVVLPKTKVYKCSLIDFISEYRCFITNGEIRGMHHYKGSFEHFPNMEIVKEMVYVFKSCPSAYTLDVGVADDGSTYLVEVNDMWAVGSYGCDGETYALLSARRFKEIVKLSEVTKLETVKGDGYQYVNEEVTGWYRDDFWIKDAPYGYYPPVVTLDTAYESVLARRLWDRDKIKNNG